MLDTRNSQARIQSARIQSARFRFPQFQPARWLRNPHAQTVWQAFAPRHGPRRSERERWELPDGDFLDLVWLRGTTGPLIVVLHGLEGSFDSPYAQSLLAAFEDRDWGACLMHFRGCSGEPNRLRRGYHSGETSDLAALIARLRGEFPRRPIGVVGYSLGGNVLLKWLGEAGAGADIDAAVAVSAPMRLDQCALRMDQGLSRFYQTHLMRRMKRSYQRKFRARDNPPFPLTALARLSSFRQFDQHITAPLHGFSGADDYYQRCSSRRYLAGIQVPTLILHALDDPFMTPGVIPDQRELSASTRIEVSTHGGHVGFISGGSPWRPRYWLDHRIPAWFEQSIGE